MSKDIVTTKEKKSQAKPKSAVAVKKQAAPKPRRAAPRKAAKVDPKGPSKAAAKPEAKNPAKRIAKSAAEPAKVAVKSGPAVATLPVLSVGKSLEAAVPAAMAVNTKLVDMAYSNVTAGIGLARDLASAKTPMEAMRLGIAYWYDNMGLFQAQARELQSLSTAWLSTASKPIGDQARSA